jgi:1-deoxy-D-xylulose-5-phosphate synthase
MIDGTGLEEFAQKYPDRFFDVGIAEEHAVTFAGAIAKGGYKPVVAIYSTFLQRAYDEIIHDVCLQNLPVVLAIDRAGIVGEDGATHNGIWDIAYLRTLPNITVLAPADGEELTEMLGWAVQQRGPVAIRYPRGQAAEKVESREQTTESKTVIIALGSMVKPALDAAKILGDAKVVNAKVVKPLDSKLIDKAVRGAELVVTVEEGVLAGGFGSAVMEHLITNGATNQRIVRLGLPSEFIEHGKRDVVLAKYGLTAEGITAAIKRMDSTQR